MKTKIPVSVAAVLALFVVAGVGASELEPSSKSQIERKLGDKEIRVELSSANIGDCKAAAAPAPAPADESKSQAAPAEGVAAAKRAPDCDNSIQLSVRAGDKAKASKIRVKSVELFDEGRLVSKLTPKAPTAWDASGSYQKWDEKAVAGKTLSVSYPLSEPDWSKTADRHSKTFRIKVTMSVGGETLSTEEDVAIDADISLPPDVVT